MYANLSKSPYKYKHLNTHQDQRLRFSSKKRFIIFLVCTFIIILSFTIFVKGYAQNNDSSTHIVSTGERIVVQSGDSLWLIASQYKPEDISINSYIRQIKRENLLTSSVIEVGQVLYLP